MKFTKMHGCGNDYIYVNCLEEQVENPEKTAVFVSDRHFGIGSDGLILIGPSTQADFQMRMYNADGSEGEMCGNAIRCIAKYVYDHGLANKKKISIDTRAGIKQLELTVEEGKVSLVRVNMGTPVLESEKIPVRCEKNRCIREKLQVDGMEYEITAVSMGNPHAVVFVEDTKSLRLQEIGRKFEYHEKFPNRINTEFVQVLNEKEINMRVWERGSGETLACGTGACASVVACVLNGKTGHDVTVHLLGGELFIEYDEKQDTVWMTGPACEICSGEVIIPDF